ncbi:MAG TPA: hypothetical protein VGI13_08550 [Candidatus Acidoferrum sp.]|jgi:hypothetical protein
MADGRGDRMQDKSAGSKFRAEKTKFYILRSKVDAGVCLIVEAMSAEQAEERARAVSTHGEIHFLDEVHSVEDGLIN